MTAAGEVKPSRAPGIVWPLRKDCHEWVRTADNDGIQMWVSGQHVVMDRQTARMLARRLNECLDATVKR